MMAGTRSASLDEMRSRLSPVKNGSNRDKDNIRHVSTSQSSDDRNGMSSPRDKLSATTNSDTEMYASPSSSNIDLQRRPDLMSENEISSLVHNALMRARKATNSFSPRTRSYRSTSSRSEDSLSPTSTQSNRMMGATLSATSSSGRPPISSSSTLTSPTTSRPKVYPFSLSPSKKIISVPSLNVVTRDKIDTQFEPSSEFSPVSNKLSPRVSSVCSTDEFHSPISASVDAGKDEDMKSFVLSPSQASEQSTMSVGSVNSSDDIIRRVEEEIAKARKAAQEATRRLAGVSANFMAKVESRNLSTDSVIVTSSGRGNEITKDESSSTDEDGSFDSALNVIGEEFDEIISCRSETIDLNKYQISSDSEKSIYKAQDQDSSKKEDMDAVKTASGKETELVKSCSEELNDLLTDGNSSHEEKLTVTSVDKNLNVQVTSVKTASEKETELDKSCSEELNALLTENNSTHKENLIVPVTTEEKKGNDMNRLSVTSSSHVETLVVDGLPVVNSISHSDDISVERQRSQTSRYTSSFTYLNSNALEIMDPNNGSYKTEKLVLTRSIEECSLEYELNILLTEGSEDIENEEKDFSSRTKTVASISKSIDGIDELEAVLSDDRTKTVVSISKSIDDIHQLEAVLSDEKAQDILDASTEVSGIESMPSHQVVAVVMKESIAPAPGDQAIFTDKDEKCEEDEMKKSGEYVTVTQQVDASVIDSHELDDTSNYQVISSQQKKTEKPIQTYGQEKLLSNFGNASSTKSEDAAKNLHEESIEQTVTPPEVLKSLSKDKLTSGRISRNEVEMSSEKLEDFVDKKEALECLTGNEFHVNESHDTSTSERILSDEVDEYIANLEESARMRVYTIRTKASLDGTKTEVDCTEPKEQEVLVHIGHDIDSSEIRNHSDHVGGEIIDDQVENEISINNTIENEDNLSTDIKTNESKDTVRTQSRGNETSEDVERKTMGILNMISDVTTNDNGTIAHDQETVVIDNKHHVTNRVLNNLLTQMDKNKSLDGSPKPHSPTACGNMTPSKEYLTGHCDDLVDNTGEISCHGKKVNFKQRYPIPQKMKNFRDPSKIMFDYQLEEPSDKLWHSVPKKDLKELLEAVTGKSIQRRSNACGALKVMSTQKKNQMTLVRTHGFMDALMLVISENYSIKELEAEKSARARAVNVVLNVSTTKNDRYHILQHPGLRDSLVKCMIEDTAEARELACAVLATLAKSQHCREPMAKTEKLVDTLAKILKGNDSPNFDVDDQSQTYLDEGKIDYSGDDERSGGVSNTFSSSSASSSANSSYGNESVETQKQESEMRRRTRMNAAAVLLHLSKECSISQELCANDQLLSCLVSCCKELQNPIHTKSLQILANLSRFPHNNVRLVGYPTFVDALIVNGSQEDDFDRLWSMRIFQNLSSEPTAKAKLACSRVLELLSSNMMRKQYEEQLAATSTIYNISTEPGAVVLLTNTKNVVATLVHIAHSPKSVNDVRTIACDTLATLGLWLQTLAGSATVPEGLKPVPLPSYITFGWQRWDL